MTNHHTQKNSYSNFFGTKKSLTTISIVRDFFCEADEPSTFHCWADEPSALQSYCTITLKVNFLPSATATPVYCPAGRAMWLMVDALSMRFTITPLAL